MTEHDNTNLILFLEAFKNELLSLVETLKTRIVTRRQLNNVVVFRVADSAEQTVIHEMVDEVIIRNGDELDSGLSSSDPVINVDQASEVTNGESTSKGRAYASRNFRSSDKEAA